VFAVEAGGCGAAGQGGEREARGEKEASEDHGSRVRRR
jgi:hypothetical protein